MIKKIFTYHQSNRYLALNEQNHRIEKAQNGSYPFDVMAKDPRSKPMIEGLRKLIGIISTEKLDHVIHEAVLALAEINNACNYLFNKLTGQKDIGAFEIQPFFSSLLREASGNQSGLLIRITQLAEHHPIFDKPDGAGLEACALTQAYESALRASTHIARGNVRSRSQSFFEARPRTSSAVNLADTDSDEDSGFVLVN